MTCCVRLQTAASTCMSNKRKNNNYHVCLDALLDVQVLFMKLCPCPQRLLHHLCRLAVLIPPPGRKRKESLYRLLLFKESDQFCRLLQFHIAMTSRHSMTQTARDTIHFSPSWALVQSPRKSNNTVCCRMAECRYCVSWCQWHCPLHTQLSQVFYLHIAPCYCSCVYEWIYVLIDLPACVCSLCYIAFWGFLWGNMCFPSRCFHTGISLLWCVNMQIDKVPRMNYAPWTRSLDDNSMATGSTSTIDHSTTDIWELYDLKSLATNQTLADW